MYQNHSSIIPQRYLPFDIGAPIKAEQKAKLAAFFLQEGYNAMPIPTLLKSISLDVLFKVEITSTLHLYIFSYGIGVFVMEDTPYPIKEDAYALPYCGYRKKAHQALLEFQYGEISDTIDQIITQIRALVKDKKTVLRTSADKHWEHHGLSYVMTVSYIINKEASCKDYMNFSDMDKKNLQMLLHPNLAHEEDTMAISKLKAQVSAFDPYSFDLTRQNEPKNWIASEDCAIYISWAAVIVYLKEPSQKYMEIIEYLEVDLQAMWLYTYCQSINLKTSSLKKRVIDLKKEKYTFQRKYNEFKGDCDSSISMYIMEIRNELIRTSGIEDEKNNYMEYLAYCIDETESLEGEQQRKYSIMNEILLFVIAYIQIAPMLYQFLIGEYDSFQIGPMLILIIIAMIAIWLIIRKD